LRRRAAGGGGIFSAFLPRRVPFLGRPVEESEPQSRREARSKTFVSVTATATAKVSLGK
tara:strand:- start:1851 stop:2027 length:177 start_codon:yes stop_codon:yes gene_type:complete